MRGEQSSSSPDFGSASCQCLYIREERTRTMLSFLEILCERLLLVALSARRRLRGGFADAFVLRGAIELGVTPGE